MSASDACGCLTTTRARWATAAAFCGGFTKRQNGTNSARYSKASGYSTAFAGSLTTAFLIRGVGFSAAEVGAINKVRVPEVGSVVSQGERAWTLVASDNKTVDMLSPVDGTIVEVNDRSARDPRYVTHDPYGAGWLLKIKSSRLAANTKQLLTGGMAKRWIEESCNALCTVNPELGPVSLDGGAPMSGMLRALDPDNWDQVAKTFFLS